MVIMISFTLSKRFLLKVQINFCFAFYGSRGCQTANWIKKYFKVIKEYIEVKMLSSVEWEDVFHCRTQLMNSPRIYMTIWEWLLLIKIMKDGLKVSSTKLNANRVCHFVNLLVILTTKHTLNLAFKNPIFCLKFYETLFMRIKVLLIFWISYKPYRSENQCYFLIFNITAKISFYSHCFLFWAWNYTHHFKMHVNRTLC